MARRGHMHRAALLERMSRFLVGLGLAAGIVKDVTQVDMDKWFGQQAVYRVSMGNFVSRVREPSNRGLQCAAKASSPSRSALLTCVA